MPDEFAAPTPPPPTYGHGYGAPGYAAPDLSLPAAPSPGPPRGGLPLGRAAYPNAPNYGAQNASAAPWAPLPAPAQPSAPVPLNLRAPDTIDFGAGAPAVIVKRAGPPGWFILIVIVGAAIGGARLAHVVTRKDMAALEVELEAGAKTAPPPAPPAVER
jgi:hypothetical protein